MLRELAVQNLALIEDVRVELEPGFCAWTGETGAGKTLLLSALGLLLGERGSSELIRTGADETRVTGRFELTHPEQKPALEELLQREVVGSELLLARRLTKSGRSFAYIDDQPVTVQTLRAVGNLLVDLHGQRESLSLLESAYQLQLLDAFGNLGSQRARYESHAQQVLKLRKDAERLTNERAQRQRELTLLRFEREELDAADLDPGEKAALQKERDRLGHAQGLQTFANHSAGRLYDDENSCCDQLGKIHREAEGWSKLAPELLDFTQRLQAQLVELQDLARLLSQLGQKWEADPARLDEVEARLQQLRRLEAKYGKSIADLCQYRESLDAQERALQAQEDDLAGIELALSKEFAELKLAADELSQKRHAAAKKLAAAVLAHLVALGMPDAQLTAALEPTPLGPDPRTSPVPAHGVEQLELMLAANQGEPARPLRKVASGGEMSRTMLALKTVLAAHDHVGTLIFDEIDANVGGRLGDILGEKLASLGKSHQVICVTHLPQVACYAKHQWSIRKKRKGQRTTTHIELLRHEERQEEIAQMLRGEARTETTRKEAAAMLDSARKQW